MNRNHKSLWIAALCFGLFGLGVQRLLSNAGNPPTGQSGSPGDGSTCASCHSGGSFGAAMSVSGLPGKYKPGQNYPLTVSQSGTAPRHGFEITAEKSGGTKMGSWTANLGGGGSAVLSTNWVGHNNADTSTSWNISWTAPGAGNGAITFYVAGNAANNDSGTGGDQIVTNSYTVQEAIPPANVRFSTTDVTTANLTWTLNSGSSYLMAISSVSNFSLIYSSSTGILNQNSTMYFGLSANTTYYFKVKITTDTDDTYSTTIASATRAGIPAVAGVTYPTVTANSINVQWQGTGNPSGTKYVLEVATMNTFTGTVTSSATTALSLSTSGLMSSTTYFFQVKSVNHNGFSSGYLTLGSTKTVDVTPPTVGIVFPANNSFVSSIGSITGTAADNEGILKAEVIIRRETDGFHWDGGAWNPPFSSRTCNLSLPSWFYPGGGDSSPSWTSLSSYTIIARSIDFAGNFSTVYATHVFTYDTSPPTQITGFSATQSSAASKVELSWISPGENVALGALGVGTEFRVQYSSADPSLTAWAPANAQFILDSSGTAQGIVVSTHLTLPPSINYYFRIWAKDRAGNFSTQSSTAGAFNSPFSFETVDGNGFDAGDSRGLAIDKDGNLHVAYRNGTTPALKYIKRTGLSWGAPQTISPVDSSDVSIAVDAFGNPHVAYRDVTNSKLRYAKYNGVSWSTQTVDNVANPSPSIAIDGAGNPKIAYGVYSTGDLMFAEWTGSTWTVQSVDTAGLGSNGVYVSLALDGAGNPNIGYSLPTGGSSAYNLKFASWTAAGGWTITQIEGTGQNTADVGLALDGNGYGHIFYYSYNTQTVKYAKFNGSTWNIQTVDNSGNGGRANGMTLDGSGNVHAVYCDRTVDQDLKYARYNGIQWSTATVDSNGLLANNRNAIALDGSGDVHIAYWDTTNLDLKAAHWTSAGFVAPMGGNPYGKVQAPYLMSGMALGTSSITWSWTNSSSNAVGYRVYYSTPGVVFQIGADTATLAGNAASAWTQTGLSPNTQYAAYSVAVNTGGVVTSSAASRFTFADVPASPYFTAVAATNVVVNWYPNGNPTAYTDYEVQYSSVSNFSLISSSYVVNVGTTPMASLINLQEATTVYVRIRAQNEEGVYGLFSAVVATRTARATPTLVTWVRSGGSANASIPVNWSPYGVPINGDNIIFNGSSVQNCTWDVSSVALSSATMDTGYTGTVTLSTTMVLAGHFKQKAGTLSTAANRIRLKGNLIQDGGSMTGIDINFVFEGTATQRIMGASPLGIVGFEVNNSSEVVAQQAMFINGSVHITSGSFSAGNFSHTVGGDWKQTSSGSFTANGSTITFDSVTSTRMVVTGPGSFNHFKVDSSTTVYLFNSLNVLGNVVLASGTFNVSTQSILVGGDWRESGIAKFQALAGSVTFNGSGSQSITLLSGNYFNNIVMNKVGSTLLAQSLVTAKGNFTMVTGTLNPNSNAIKISGDFRDLGGSLTLSGGFEFDGGGLQLLDTALPMPGIKIINTSGSGVRKLNGNLDMSGCACNLELEPGSKLDLQNNHILSAGNIFSSGTLVDISSVAFVGSASQTVWMTATSTFNHVTLSKSGGNVRLGSNVTVGGKLQFSAGNNSTLDLMAGSHVFQGTVSLKSGILDVKSSSVTFNSSIFVDGGLFRMPSATPASRVHLPSGRKIFIYQGGTLEASTGTLTASDGIYDQRVQVNGGFVNVTGLQIDYLTTTPALEILAGSTITSLSNMRFGPNAGATGNSLYMGLAGGTYTFQNFHFDYFTAGYNISAPNLVGGVSNYILAPGSFGGHSGPSYESDPNNVIFWSTPIAPTLVALTTADIRSDDITWKWLDSSNDEQGYRLFSTTGATAVSPDLPSNTTGYMQTELIPNTSYSIYVKAFNPMGVSTATTILSTYTMAVSPGVVGYTAHTTSISVTLDRGLNPAYTELRVEASSNAFTSSLVAAQSTNTFIPVTGLAANTTYFVRAYAVNVNLFNSTATLVTVSTATLTYPPQLSGFSVFVTSVSIVLGANGNPAGTKMVVSTGSGGFFNVPFSSAGALSGSTITLTITNLSTNTAYSFQAGSVGSGVNASTNPIPVTASTMTASVSPVVTGFQVFSTSVTVNLGLNSNPAGTTLAVTTGSFQVSDSTSGPVTMLTLNNLIPNTTYTIYARSVNGNGLPSGAVAVAASTETLPNAPTSPTLSSVQVSSMVFSWNGNGNPLPPLTTYQIQAATSPTFTPLTVNAVMSSLSLTGSTLTANTSYYWRVQAISSGSSSGFTAAIATYTLALPPTGSAFIGVFTSSIVVGWQGSSNPAITSYDVRYSTISNFSVELSTVIVASTQAVVNGLVDGTTYYVRVRSLNGNGLPSAFDAPLSTATRFAPGVRIWAAASPSNAASPLNWQPPQVPENGDTIFFNATSVQNCSWDLAGVVLSSMVMQAAYSGTVTLSTEVVLSGDLVLNGGVLNASSRKVTIQRDYDRSGGGLSIDTASEFIFNGPSLQRIRGASAGLMPETKIMTSSNVVLETGIDVRGILRLSSGTLLSGAYEHLIGGWVQLAGSTFNAQGSTYTARDVLNRDIQIQSLNGNPFTHFKVDNSSTVTFLSALETSGHFTLSSGILNLSNVFTHQIGGDWRQTGGTVSGGNAFTEFKVGGHFTQTGGVFLATGPFTFNGNSQTLSMLTSAQFSILQSSPSGTLTALTDVAIARELILSRGNFTNGSNRVKLARDIVAQGGTFVRNSGVWEFNGASTQSILSNTDWGTVVVNNPPGMSFNGDSTVVNLSIQPGAKFKASNGQKISVTGAWVSSGTFEGSGSTVAFTGGSAQTVWNVVSSTFSHVEVNKSAGITLQALSNLDMENLDVLGGNFNLGSNTISLSGKLNDGAGNLQAGVGSTVQFTGTQPAQINQNGSSSLYHLRVNKPGTSLTATAALTIDGSVYLDQGSFNAGAQTHFIAGGLVATTGGDMPSTGYSLEFNGSSAQVIQISSRTFDRFIINTSSKVILNTQGVGVSQVATMTVNSGLFELGVASFTVSTMSVQPGAYFASASNAKLTGPVQFNGTMTVTSMVYDGVNAQELRIGPTAKINALDNVKFQNTSASKPALRFSIPSGTFTLTGLYFSISVASHNIDAAAFTGPGYIAMANSTGPLSGPAYENDPNNLVFWSAPAAPSNFSASFGTSTVSYSWTDVNDETGYRLRRSSDNSIVTSLAANVTTHLLVNVGTNTLVSNFIESFNPLGSSSTTAISTYTLAMPPVNTATGTLTTSTVDLSWLANGNAAGTQYTVEFSTMPGFSPSSSFAQTALSTSVAGLSANSTYYFRVRAQNGNGIATGFDATLFARTLPAPKTWIKAGAPGNASDPFNWSPTGAPQDGDVVTFDGSGIANCSWDITVPLKSVSVLSGYTGTLTVGTSLTADDVLQDAGTIVLGGGTKLITRKTLVRNGGTFNAAAGSSVEFTGSSTQTVGGSLTPATFGNAEFLLNSSSDVVAQQNLDINGNVTFGSALGRFRAGSFAHTVSGNWTHYSSSGTFDAGSSTITFDGTGAQYVREEGNGGGFYNFTVLSSSSVAVSSATWTGIFKITQGTVTWQPPLEIRNLAQLHLPSNSPSPVLRVSGTMANYGSFRSDSASNIVSTAAGFAVINGTGSWNVSGMEMSGVRLNIDGETPSVTLNNVRWRDMQSGQAALRFTMNNAGNLTLTGHDFDSTVSTNVAAGTVTSGNITLLNSSGNRYGFAYEFDPNSRVEWEPKPNAPTMNSTETAASTTSIKWNWNDNSSDEGGFKIWSTSGGVLNGTLLVNTTKYVVSSLTPNTSYSAYVEAYNLNGSTFSAPLSRHTLANPATGMIFTAIAQSSVSVQWFGNANSTNTRYELSYSTYPNFSVLVTTPIPLSSAWTQTTTTFLGLLSDTTYYFRAQAYNGDSVPSGFDATSASGTITLPAPPNAPTGVSGTAVSSTTIQWSWTDASSSELGFHVRQTSSSLSISGALAANTNTFTETGLLPSTSHAIYVEAFNVVGTSFSAQATRWTLAAIPSNLAVVSVSSSNVSLSWTGVAGTLYRVERSTDNAQYAHLSTTTAGASAYNDLSAASDSTYYFRLAAINGENVVSSGFTNVVTTVTNPGPPAQPGSVAGSALGVSSITWSWTDLVNEQGYRVISTTGGSLAGNLAANTTAFTATGLLTNTSYGIYVQAFNATGSSDSAVTVRYTLPAQPGSGSVSNVNYSSFTVSWTLNGNPTGTLFKADYGTDPAFAAFSSVTTTALTYTLTGLANNATYYVRIAGVNGDGSSGLYNVATSTFLADTIAPNQVTNLSAVNTGYPGELRLTWAIPSEDGTLGGGAPVSFDLRYATTDFASGDFTTQVSSVIAASGSVGQTQTALINGLTDNVTYFFRIRAVDNVGNTGTISLSSNAYPGDLAAPDAITTFAGATTGISGEVRLTWTVPREYGVQSVPSVYDLRYGTGSFNNATFSAQTSVLISTSGQAVGDTIGYTVTGLNPGSLYYFRIKSRDGNGNVSAIDSAPAVVVSVTGDTKRPATINDLVAQTGSQEGALVLTWTVPIEDFDIPTSSAATSYDIRIATVAFTDLEFSSKTQYQVSNGSVAAGQIFTYTIQGLSAGTTYFVHIKSLDEMSNVSLIDNVSPQASARSGFVQTGTIAGKVTMANDQPITAVEVRAEPEGVVAAVVTAFTKTDGTYRLEGLQTNITYKVTVTWIVNQIKSSAFRAKISANSSSALNFKLEVIFRLATITGQLSLAPGVKEAIRNAALFAAPGAPIEGPAYIEIIQEGRVVAKKHTDEDGRYSIPNLLPGVYQVRAYNGKAYSEVKTVSLDGGDFALTFQFALLPQESVYNYPNPVVTGRDGARTTLRFESGVEDLEAEIRLWTISGELVRTVPLKAMRVEGVTYKFDWDLTNQGGEPVAPGVYIMQVRARNTKTDEKAIVTKKIAIVR